MEYSRKVEDTQAYLMALGYDVGPDGADGYLGPNTAAAIKKFQDENGLVPDGAVSDELFKTVQERYLKEMETPKEVSPTGPSEGSYGTGGMGVGAAGGEVGGGIGGSDVTGVNVPKASPIPEGSGMSGGTFTGGGSTLASEVIKFLKEKAKNLDPSQKYFQRNIDRLYNIERK